MLRVGVFQCVVCVCEKKNPDLKTLSLSGELSVRRELQFLVLVGLVERLLRNLGALFVVYDSRTWNLPLSFSFPLNSYFK